MFPVLPSVGIFREGWDEALCLAVKLVFGEQKDCEFTRKLTSLSSDHFFDCLHLLSHRQAPACLPLRRPQKGAWAEMGTGVWASFIQNAFEI